MLFFALSVVDIRQHAKNVDYVLCILQTAERHWHYVPAALQLARSACCVRNEVSSAGCIHDFLRDTSKVSSVEIVGT